MADIIEIMAKAASDNYAARWEDMALWEGFTEPLRENKRDDMRAAIRAAEAAGWKLVPVEPTKGMVTAGELESCWASEAYAAMLAATPTIGEKKCLT